ncbi:hypothetical protein [Pseudoxanthomonas sp. 10H]|uniref:hypothetical protein n=1 Tax=Pseudoxanthomonas sp. 10H TaxID=3242729 RepID=UPI0035575BAC
MLHHPHGTQAEIARGLGFNDYQPGTGVDFAPAHVFWKDTQERARAGTGSGRGRRALRREAKDDGMAMILRFTRAAEEEDGRKVADATIDEVFAERVEPAR